MQQSFEFDSEAILDEVVSWTKITTDIGMCLQPNS